MKGWGVLWTAVIYRRAACGLHPFCRRLFCVTWRTVWLDGRRFAAPLRHALWTRRWLLTFLKWWEQKKNLKLDQTWVSNACHNEPYFISDSLKLLITHPEEKKTKTEHQPSALIAAVKVKKRKKLFNEQSQKIIHSIAGLLQIILTTQL